MPFPTRAWSRAARPVIHPVVAQHLEQANILFDVKGSFLVIRVAYFPDPDGVVDTEGFQEPDLLAEKLVGSFGSVPHAKLIHSNRMSWVLHLPIANGLDLPSHLRQGLLEGQCARLLVGRVRVLVRHILVGGVDQLLPLERLPDLQTS